MTEPTPKRRRARKSDGKFKGDNPATPDVNEAWEPTPMEDALSSKNENKYEVAPKVSGVSSNSAGKYGKKSKVTTPGFGNVIRTTY